ncbi:MAG: EAL domain-containing protein [Gammaproteobacteria bacterium]|nr:EAL domain-containing protein [Gammaproteobacteria bacterium]
MQWRIYLKYWLLTYLIIGSFATVQLVFVYDEFHPQFVVIPAVVAFIIGSLLGKLAVVREQLHENGERFRAVADMAQEFIYYRNLSGEYQYVSPSVEALTGYSADEFYKHSNFMDRIVHPEDQASWKRHIDDANGEGIAESLDIRILTRDKQLKWINHVSAPVVNEKGRLIGVRTANVDITAQKLHEEQVFRLAYYDALTGLPNRQLFEKNLEDMIKKSSSEKDVFAVLFLDLDRFKNINDSFGHKLGDKVLVEVTHMVEELCGNDCLLSRFGGDEFVLICADVTDKYTAESFARKIISKIEQPFIIDDIVFYMSASIGVAFYPQDGSDFSTLVRNADTAMYKSKKDMSSKILFYHTEFGNETTHFVTTEAEIHKGIRDKEFIPYYQPKVDIRSGKIVGLEALARWDNAEQGIIMPAKFIDVAEETGQIIEIGKQVVERVIDDMVRWSEDGIEIPVAINVSARQFANSTYCNDIESMMRESPLSTGLIEVEITEQVFLGDLELARERINNFRAKGVRIALDDFGTGYSSLSYLRQLPIDVLKIDKSFIDNITHDDTSRAIMKAIVSICQDLNYMPVAEGVETEEQKEQLLQMGCPYAQGYLFYKAISAEDVRNILLSSEQTRARSFIADQEDH